jgi:transposase InsO family protein
VFNPNRRYDHHAGGMAVPGSNPRSVQPERGGLEIDRDFGGRTGSDGVRKRFADAPANPGLYFHSDQGSRYSSEAVKTPLAVIGANLSMSSRGNWAKNDREKTELIPGKETHSRSEKVSPIHCKASILEGPWNRGSNRKTCRPRRSRRTRSRRIVGSQWSKSRSFRLRFLPP